MVTDTKTERTAFEVYLRAKMPEHLRSASSPPRTWDRDPEEWAAIIELARAAWVGQKALEFVNGIAVAERYPDEVISGQRRPIAAQLCQLSDDQVRRAVAARDALRARHRELDTLSQHQLELAALGSADVSPAQAEAAISAAEARVTTIDAERASAAAEEAEKIPVDITGDCGPGRKYTGTVAKPIRYWLTPEALQELRDWWKEFLAKNAGKDLGSVGYPQGCPFAVVDA